MLIKILAIMDCYVAFMLGIDSYYNNSVYMFNSAYYWWNVVDWNVEYDIYLLQYLWDIL
jgi:hypothetical protein